MKQKFWQLLPAILFFLLFAVLLVLLLFGPRETRSLTEGRALAGRPVMDLHDPAALTQAFTDYAADHLPLREDLLRLDTRVQVALGKRSVRDALIADDGWLFLRVYRADFWQRERLLSALDHAMQDCPDVSFVYGVLPHKTDALPERTAPYLDSRIGTENRQTLEAAMEERLPGLLAVDVAGEFLTNYSASERESFYLRRTSTGIRAARLPPRLILPQPCRKTACWTVWCCPRRRTLPGRTLTVPIAVT